MDDPRVPRLDGKFAVVTGATSGIGETTARRLAEAGATVIVAGRDPRRGRETLERIRSRVPDARLDLVIADLSLASGAAAAANAIRGGYPQVDILINNAGGVFMRRELTAEGVERTWALNVLGPYRLTMGLMEPLLAAGSARVVNVASEAHRGYALDFTDLEAKRRFRGFSQYGRSKVALILLSSEFARQWAGKGVTFLSVHPGFVRTRFGLNNGGAFAILIRALGRAFGLSAERGSDTPVFAATAPEMAQRPGVYLAKKHVRTASPEASDPASAAKLWEVLARA